MDIEEQIERKILYFKRSLPDMKYEHSTMYSQLVEKLYRLEHRVLALEKELKEEREEKE